MSQYQVDIVFDRLGREMKKRLRKATDFLVGTIKENIGFVGPPRSQPGQFPHMDTTALHDSIEGKVHGWGSVVTASTEYASMLEFGTDKMAARPFMQPSLQEASTDISRILVGKEPTYDGGE